MAPMFKYFKMTMNLIEYSNHYSSGSQTLICLRVTRGTSQYGCLGHRRRSLDSVENMLPTSLTLTSGDSHVAGPWGTF